MFGRPTCELPTIVATVTHTTATLEGKSAIITGGSRGIGLASATELAARGAAVTINARKEEPLEEAAEQIRKEVPGAKVLAIAGNSGDADTRRDIVDQAVAAHGGIHILVNNTGINPQIGPLMDTDPRAALKTFDVNVVAALGFVQECYRAGMRESGGSVINIASVAGLRAAGPLAIYGASKAALIKITEELAAQLGPTIRVNAIAPAVVKTKFAELLYAHDEDAVASPYPLKRLGVPQDIANLVAFLAGDESSWITGETIRIDGGSGTIMGAAG